MIITISIILCGICIGWAMINIYEDTNKPHSIKISKQDSEDTLSTIDTNSVYTITTKELEEIF